MTFGIQYDIIFAMSNTHADTPTKSRSRAQAEMEEQALCVAAVESGLYDQLSDQEWIMLCEKVAAGAITLPDDPDEVRAVLEVCLAEYHAATSS